MNNIMFNRELCSKCGLCAADCPVSYISMSSGRPEISGNICVSCGHCEAICPNNAVSVVVEHPVSVQGIQKHTIKAEELAAYMKMRRSIRNFKQETVSKETIEKIFDAVRYAPTGMNRQPVKWAVTVNPQSTRKLLPQVVRWMKEVMQKNHDMSDQYGFPMLVKSCEEGFDPVLRNAPHLAVAYAEKIDRIAAGDCMIALTHFELLASAFGIGACWAGYFNMAAVNDRKIADMIGLPENCAPFGTLMFGYPKVSYKRLPKRKNIEIKWI